MLKTYKSELEELIEKLRKSEVDVVISGDPFNKNKSFMVSLYTENLTIETERVAGSGSITIEIIFTGLKGTHIAVPKLFGKDTLRAMQYGLLLTDGSVHKKGYPQMNMNQTWQVFTWLLAWPGRNHVHIYGVGINGNDVGIAWNLMAIDHKGEFESKAVVAEEVNKLDDDGFPLFLLFAILSDGSVNVEKSKIVNLYIGKTKREIWGGNIIERLRSSGLERGMRSVE